VTGVPRFTASLRAIASAPMTLLVWVVTRLRRMVSWNEGMPMPSRMAATVMAIISSIRVKPAGRRHARRDPTWYGGFFMAGTLPATAMTGNCVRPAVYG
jgi:hypothetical protein